MINLTKYKQKIASYCNEFFDFKSDSSKNESPTYKKYILWGGLVICFGLAGWGINFFEHKNDGYYRIGNDIYYHYKELWAKYNIYKEDWVNTSVCISDYDKYFVSKDYSQDLEVPDMYNSNLWNTWRQPVKINDDDY